MGLIYCLFYRNGVLVLGHKTYELSDEQKCLDFFTTCPSLPTVQVTQKAYIFPPSIGTHISYKLNPSGYEQYLYLDKGTDHHFPLLLYFQAIAFIVQNVLHVSALPLSRYEAQA